MNDSMNVDVNGDSSTPYTSEHVEQVILGQDASTKKDTNELLVQTLLKQNEMLMSMLALKGRQPEEMYVPPDLSKTLPTFDGRCKPHKLLIG